MSVINGMLRALRERDDAILSACTVVRAVPNRDRRTNYLPWLLLALLLAAGLATGYWWLRASNDVPKRPPVTPDAHIAGTQPRVLAPPAAAHVLPPPDDIHPIVLAHKPAAHRIPPVAVDDGTTPGPDQLVTSATGDRHTTPRRPILDR